MSKVYSELVYHFVWATRDRLALITPEVQVHLLPFLETKCREEGYLLHAVNCVDDHVHLLVTLRPRDSVPDVAKKLKGSSSHFINKELKLGGILYWQRGYSVVTLAKRDIPAVAEYIRRQEDHHQGDGKVIADLERVGPSG